MLLFSLISLVQAAGEQSVGDAGAVCLFFVSTHIKTSGQVVVVIVGWCLVAGAVLDALRPQLYSSTKH